MSRTTLTLPNSQSPQALSAANDVLQQNGFAFSQTEAHWKKGTGLLVAPQFVKLSVTPQGIQLEAWLQFALLPGVFMGEFDLEGAFMLIPKRQLRSVVKKVEDALGGSEAPAIPPLPAG